MSQPTPHPERLLGGPNDPDLDPSAVYALEPGYVAALTGRIVSTSADAVLSISPVNGQALAHLPQSSEKRGTA